MIEIFRCGHKTQPRLWVDKKIYGKARKLYSRRKEFRRIEPDFAIIKLIVKKLDIDLEYKLYDKYSWYEYKNRIFIFRKGLPLASFVVKGDKIYNPLIACGGIYSSIYNRIFKTSWFIYIIASLYEGDIELLVRERE